MTKQRMVICNIVKQSDCHLTAAQIAEEAKKELGSVALATVYNNLNALVDEGIIGKITVDGRTDLYDKSPCSHAHLCCEKCGRVKDVSVRGITDFLSEKTEEEIDGYLLVMKYVCKECKKKK